MVPPVEPIDVLLIENAELPESEAEMFPERSVPVTLIDVVVDSPTIARIEAFEGETSIVGFLLIIGSVSVIVVLICARLEAL